MPYPDPGDPPPGQTGGTPWGSIATVAAPIVEGAIGAWSQQRANTANAQQAREQMQFQERMSNTAWQRGVADMKAAGLNPALAYQRGGADSPGGTSARMEPALASLKGTAQSAASTYAQLATTKQQVEQMKAQTANIHANTIQTLLESDPRRRTQVATADQAEVAGNIAKNTQAHQLSSEQARLLGVFQKGNYDHDYYLELMKSIPLIMKKMQADLNLTQNTARESGARADILAPDAAVAKNWYGKHVRPYIGDAKTLSEQLKKWAF